MTDLETRMTQRMLHRRFLNQSNPFTMISTMSKYIFAISVVILIQAHISWCNFTPRSPIRNLKEHMMRQGQGRKCWTKHLWLRRTFWGCNNHQFTHCIVCGYSSVPRSRCFWGSAVHGQSSVSAGLLEQNIPVHRVPRYRVRRSVTLRGATGTKYSSTRR
jgi:hypothetical protein